MSIFNGTIDTDFLDGTADADTLRGFAGNDTIFGREGNDLLNGDSGDDLLNGNQNQDTVAGGDGDDWVRGGKDNDQLFGDAGNDTLHGDRGNDTAFGGDGNDLLFGDTGAEANFTGNGNDLLYGELGNDTLFGLGGNDQLFGGSRDDLLSANKGDDTVFGGDGNDLIRGGQDNDLLFGDAGNDIIYGDLGADTLNGGEGNDSFVIGRRFDVPGFRTTGGLNIADADSIADFNISQDSLELIGGLTFEDLNIFNGSGTNTGNTIIQDKLTGEYLAIVKGINASIFTAPKSALIPEVITPPSNGILQFSAPTFGINEDGTPIAAVTITRTDGSSGAIAVQVRLNGGSAIGGATPLAAPKDYDNSFITVNWASGDTSPKTVTVPIFNDLEVEGNETVNLILDSPTGGATIGTQNTAVLTILDNDIQPTPTPGTLSFTSANYSDLEGNSDTTNKIVATIQLAGASDRIVTVQLQLGEGSTATPNDFTNNLPITITFNPGETSKDVELPILGDTITEGDDTINLKLINPTGGASLGTQQTTTYTIVNDDIAVNEPEIEVLDAEANIAAGNGSVNFGTTTVGKEITKTFTVKNTGTADLNLSTINLPNGFSLASGFTSLTLASGTQTTFSVKLDTSAAGTRSGTLSFGNNDSDENPFDFALEGTVTDVPVPEIEVLDGKNNIPDGTNTAIDFGITNIGKAITKTFTVRNIGSETLNLLDRNLPAGFSWLGTLTSSIAPGGSASFEVQLDASNAGSFNGTLLFTNNDSDESTFDFPISGTVEPLPTISITATDIEAAEVGGNTGNYRITRTGNTGNDLIVNLTIDGSSTVTSNAGGAFGVDYDFSVSGGGTISGTGANRSLIIPAGESFVDVTLTPFDDEHAEADETLKLNLASGSYTIDGTNNHATVTIAANDTVAINTNDSVDNYALREGSLRQAMLNAIALPGADKITFAGAGASGTINLTAALPEISGANANNTTIDGSGANILTVRRDTGGEYRIFTVGNNVNAAFSNLNIANGRANDGGGILNLGGTITVANTNFSGNIANNQGGGILNLGGTVSVTNSNFSGNMAARTGSGILNQGGRVSVTNTTISTNNAPNFFGSSISNFGGTFSIANSLLSGNPASLNRGIHNNFGATLNITNSTIFGNYVTFDPANIDSGKGAGIFNANNSRVNLTNSTISGNSGTEGAGVFNLGGTVTAKNTLIAGNIASNGPDFGGILTSQGYNLIGNASTAVITGDITGNILNVAANLGALQDNGGITQTMALIQGSPAINAGDPNFTSPPETDQRGMGFARIRGGRIDIGAFESDFSPIPGALSLSQMPFLQP